MLIVVRVECGERSVLSARAKCVALHLARHQRPSWAPSFPYREPNYQPSYRCPHRVSSFIDYLWLSFQKSTHAPTLSAHKPAACVGTRNLLRLSHVTGTIYCSFARDADKR